jgi:dihydropteroate synthase
VRRFAGIALDRPLVMGVVNVTPDSFSDGGLHADTAEAIAHGRRLIAEGADIVDVGGESTRPGAAPVDPGEEERRVVPVIQALAASGAVVSVDTRNVPVMRAALRAGARIVNDVNALRAPGAIACVREHKAAAVLMHMRGDPRSMQHAPHYDDVVGEVSAFLAERLASCRAAGMTDDQLCVDPGIGFGKTVDHNLALLRGLDRLAALGAPVLVGVSRKSFIAKLSRGEAPGDRLGGSLAAALWAVAHGAAILRAHDVAATAQALAIWGKIDARA